MIYTLFALYLDNVLPTPGGMRKPIYFFLTPSYWCPKPVKVNQQDNKDGLLDKTSETNATAYEAVSSDLKFQEEQNRHVLIRGLRKIFDDGKAAVDGLDIDMYMGQIFALLGHNGAGKTTTISMLTGMLVPTEGTAKAFGIDVFNEFMTLRKDLGVCTQHDSLFDDLTVAEHLEFFGKIKGLTYEEIKEETAKLLRDLKLATEERSLAKTLSGGNKRKLSVAIAFLGNPRFVMLDEPTSGMDTTMRHDLWEILANYKKDRVLVLTTHYMDEADTLGDRIGIMVDGKMITCGSSMFLKKRYGIGYNLTIIKEDSVIPTDNILNFVSSHIKGVETGLIAGEEVELRLPFSECSKFKAMFLEMDQSLEKLGIKSYGISITTLEDVFIKVGETGGEVTHEWRKSQKEIKKLENNEKQSVYSLSENAQRSCFEQFGVVIKKKVKESLRNISVLIFSVILPIALIWAGLYTNKQFFNVREHTFSIANDFPETPVLYNREAYIFNENSTTTANLLANFEKNTKGHLKPCDTNKEEFNVSKTIKNFATYIDTNRPSNTNRYGSYYIYEADGVNHKYSAITVFNLTCAQALFAFGGEISNTILQKVANIKITTTITQMQVANLIRDMAYKSQQIGQFTGLFALGLGMIPGLIGSYLVHEYEKELKSHLLLAGLPIYIYWIAYYLIDVINYYIPILSAILLAKLMEVSVFLLFINFDSYHMDGYFSQFIHFHKLHLYISRT